MSGTHNKYVPAAFFGIVLGLAGLGASWRMAAFFWPVPHSIGEAILLIATAVWANLIILYAAKWIWARAEALAEFRHPVLCCFVGLVPVSTALIGVAIRPYALHTAEALAAVGIVGQLIFGLYRTGQLKDGWPGSRDDHAGAVPLRSRRQFCQRNHPQCIRPPGLGRAVFRCRCIFMAGNRVRATPQAVHRHRATAAVAADFRVYSWHLRLSAAAPT
jgi:Voltage-dependent anion channel